MSSVFVVDRAAFFGGDWPQGFVPIAAADEPAFLDRARTAGRFVERQVAEVTPAWKQWIPYCVVRCSMAPEPAMDPELAVLLVQRTRGQSEARLHGSWSIGLGGHIEPVDAGPAVGAAGAQATTGASFFAAALRRELEEELHLRLPSLPPPRLIGLINDDATEVGSVHAGLAYLLDLNLAREAASRAVGIREISKMRGGFAHLVELQRLWQDAPCFESWSQILLHAGILGPMGGTLPPASNR